MKKNMTLAVTVLMIIILGFFSMEKVYAANNTSERVIQESTESKLVELKEKELKSLEDYQETYNSKSYGLTAYILHKVQIYSIPFCFLGIIVGAICSYVLGIRHLETQEKGMALMVSFVTLAIICQVLPLIFTIVVKFGRE